MDSAYYTTAKQATHPTPGRASHKARNPKSLHKPNIAIHFPVHASRHDSPVSARPLRHNRMQQTHRNRHGNNLHTDPGHTPHVSARQQKRRFPIIRAAPQSHLTINSSVQAHIQVIVNNDTRLVQPLRNTIRQSALHMRTTLHKRQLRTRPIQDERASRRKNLHTHI